MRNHSLGLILCKCATKCAAVPNFISRYTAMHTYTSACIKLFSFSNCNCENLAVLISCVYSEYAHFRDNIECDCYSIIPVSVKFTVNLYR